MSLLNFIGLNKIPNTEELNREQQDISWEENLEKSKNLEDTARKSLTPFYQYTSNAIKSLKDKKVSASWKKLDYSDFYKLDLYGYLYQYTPISEISLKQNTKNTFKIEGLNLEKYDFEEKIIVDFIVGDEQKREKIQVNEEDIKDSVIKITSINRQIKKVTWAGHEISLIPQWIEKIKPNSSLKQNGQIFKILKVDGDSLEIKGELDSKQSIYLDNVEMGFKLEKISQPPEESKDMAKIDENLFYFSKEQDKPELEKVKNILPYFDKERFQTLTIDENSKIELAKEQLIIKEQDGLNVKFEQEIKNISKLAFRDEKTKLLFFLKSISEKSLDAYKIQLIERENTKEDNQLSSLTTFFDDDATIKDYSCANYKTIFADSEENVLVLAQYNNQTKRYEKTLPTSNILTAEVNTYQLELQQKAIRTLENTPIKEQVNLIRLFEDKNQVTWAKNDDNYNMPNWALLTDDGRSGVDEQRSFVQKALNTNDFAILEGPPGSGKTTVILELICQLSKQGKRILLCGSTHVAIDNVLERLKASKEGEVSLMNKFNIFPIRIGDKNRISEEVKEFQIDELRSNVLKEYKDQINDISERERNEDLTDDEKQELDKSKKAKQARLDNKEALLIDIANLVCGTTMGILKYPKFGLIKDNPMPEFDYLIIDESSKTTFQEFLVPALRAKKWILVGDVKQLSPFVDREQMVANIAQLKLKDDQKLPIALQEACFLTNKIKTWIHQDDNKSTNKFAFAVTSETLQYLQSEFNANLKKGEKAYLEKQIGFMDKYERLIKLEKNTPLVTKSTYLKLSALDLIFFDKNIDDYAKKIPENFLILDVDISAINNFHFARNYAFNIKNNSFKLKEKGREYSNVIEIFEVINRELREKSWADEIAWRLDREHQLRLTDGTKIQKTKNSYKKAIEDLMPKHNYEEKGFYTNDIKNRINTIATVAQPSILESLIMGVENSQIDSTISKGFSEEELQSRRVILKYQHRMHSDISAYPREEFYTPKAKTNLDNEYSELNKTEIALQDAKAPMPIDELRNWEYTRYNNRSVWRDIKGKVYRGKNENEVREMMQELKKFVEFAKNNKQPQGEDWSIACLSFYKGQLKAISEALQKEFNQPNSFANFFIKGQAANIKIKTGTVDRFQGQEADIVFLSMTQNQRDGFLDSPNRLNVAITRAKFQLVVLGDKEYFVNKSRSEMLNRFAKSIPTNKEI